VLNIGRRGAGFAVRRRTRHHRRPACPRAVFPRIGGGWRWCMARVTPRLPVASVDGVTPTATISSSDWTRIESAYGHQISSQLRETLCNCTNNYLMFAQLEDAARPVADAIAASSASDSTRSRDPGYVAEVRTRFNRPGVYGPREHCRQRAPRSISRDRTWGRRRSPDNTPPTSNGSLPPSRRASAITISTSRCARSPGN
jgi:hypothetical protein